MNKIVDKIPFLRITAALCAGIVLGSQLPADVVFPFGSLLVVTALLLVLNVHYTYTRTTVFGIGVCFYFVVTGYLLYNRYNKPPDFINKGIFAGIVKEILQEKPNTYQSVLRIYSVSYNDSLLLTDENVLAYFQKSDKSKALVPGQTILFKASPREIKNNGNLFEFNYKRYMEKRRIYRQVYIPSGKWLLLNTAMPFSLSLLAEKERMKLLKVYNQHDWNNRQVNVMSALTLGYKKGLSAETKNTFASAGAMHVLAVSGLHTGIIFLAVSFLTGFFKKIKYGCFLFVFIIITVLWGFAFITGLSPSVMRAATMFSFMVIGQNLRRHANIYNILAASAFFLLLLNPNNLFDAGFQLSYVAVIGIVFLQPRLEKLISFRYKIFRYFWSLLTVTFAAQLATFPLVVFYFNQFPVYFWFSNLILIPAITVLIPMGMGLLIFNSVTFLSTLLAFITGHLLNYLISFLEWVEKLPRSVVNFYISEVELLFILAGLLSLFFFIELRKPLYFKGILMFFLLFLSSSLIRKTNNLFRTEIIHYNYSGQNVVHFISGKRNYVVSEEALNRSENIGNLIQNTILGLHLNSPVYITCNQSFNDSVLYLKNGLLLFEGQVVYFYKGGQNEISPFIPDIVVKAGITGENQ